MFTGIIKQTGEIVKIRKNPSGRVTIDIAASFDSPLQLGESVSVEGVCLSVAEIAAQAFRVEAVPETLRLSTLGSLKTGERVNLERSLRVGDRVDGHFVFGHVDATGTVKEIYKNGDEVLLTVSLPVRLRRYLARKGSVAINGVSLTVADLKSNQITIALIPHTLKVTTLSELKTGDEVNIEVDMLARYVAEQSAG